VKVIKLKATEAVYNKILRVLKSGGVTVLPTDTVYGLACDSEQPQACQRIYEIKGRAFQRPLAIFLANKDDIGRYADAADSTATGIIDRLLPGPVTVILKSKNRRPLIAPAGKIGIRIPDVPFLRTLIQRLGNPLAATSANISGQAEISSPELLKKQFEDTVDLLVDDRERRGPASTVIDLTTTPPTVVRKGTVSIIELERIIGRTARLARGLSFSVLFVCTGNLCRSPMAKGILKEMVGDQPVLIYSAGTDTSDGLPPTPFAVEAAQAYHADISRHRSAVLTPELIAVSDLILVMDQHHYDRVVALVPAAKPKTRFLRSYETDGREEIDDPMGGPLGIYQETARIIEAALLPVARDIKNRFEEEP